jgi:hypothetical protein
MKNLTQSQLEALHKAAATIGASYQWLYNVINLETARTWDPQIENHISHAKGLIQFMPKTARDLGYLDQYDLAKKHPTIESQLLGPVVSYFKQFAPFKTEQAFYMSVFYPLYRNMPPDTIFPADVQRDNPGIKKISDYVDFVKKLSPFPVASVAGVIIIVGLIGLFLKHFMRA